jgi:hypothetical protein
MKNEIRTIIFFLFLLSFFTGNCGRQSPPPKEDFVSPTILSTIPNNQSLDNNINTAITIVFSEIIDPASVSSKTISVRDAMTDFIIEGDLTYAGSTVVFKALSPLQAFTVYALKVTTDVRDIAGNYLQNPMITTFTTGVQGDSTAPDVLQTTPVRGAVDIGVNATIGVTFTEPMLASTITTTPSPFTLTKGTANIAGSIISFDGRTAIYAPLEPLDFSTTYVVTLSDSVTDLAGNHPPWNGNPYTWEFTTRETDLDIIRPSVLSTIPAHDANSISVNSPIVAVFDETVMASSVTSTTFLLTEKQTGTPVPGQTAVIGALALFTPASGLKCATDYLVTLITGSLGISDSSGNLLVPNSPEGYTWSFKTEPAILTITKAGTGNGIVSSSTGTLLWIDNIGTSTYADYSTQVTLAATADPGSSFTGWSGEGCSGTGTCTVTMTAARNVTAIFTLSSTLSLTVTKAGTGGGTVTANTGTLTWVANTGTATYAEYGTQVTLSATADTGSTFLGWSGEGCSGTGTCTVTMTGARNVTAAFMNNSNLLTITKAGTGTGIVSASTGTLVWLGSTGTVTYADYGIQITLTATAAPGSMFTGWSGEGCSGTGTCTVSMTVARNVTATFMYNSYSLTVTKAGTGNGIVTASAGTLLWFGNTGSATYTDYGIQVTLAAAADPGSTFIGWSGGCSGSGSCTVIMTEARNVTATFMYNSNVLTVTKAGTGNGTVSASAGTLLWFGNTGSATYTDYGIQVTLTATADPGSTFTGWSGEGCSGTGTCTVTMTAARNVTATFQIYTYLLTVTKTGNGTGLITSNTGNLTWTGKTGTATYNYNTQVIVTATADPGAIFVGWSNCDVISGNQCTVSMTATRSVVATFSK